MTYIANSIPTTAVSVLLDIAAQTRVKSSLKRGVKQAVDRELRVPGSTSARVHLVLLALLVLVAIG
jgi:hypothetical protein